MTQRLEGGSRLHKVPREVPPLVSIITVVFRARHELPPLIDSVARLKNENIEFIVIDGGSQDGTCELLSKHESVIDYWLSEPDCGVYDAMNKGIAVARGIFLFHLNIGDALIHIPFSELESAACMNVDAAAFRVSLDGTGEFRPRRGFVLRLTNTLHHQGTFYRREGFPVYNLSYPVFGDFDANQRLARRRARIEIFDCVVASHMGGGLSAVHSKENVSEYFRIITTNYGWTHLPPAWLICKWRGLRTRIARLSQWLSA